MRILLSLSGTLPSATHLQRLRYNLVIAADGSAWNLVERGLQPDMIVGDLDSFRSIPRPHDTIISGRVVHMPDQDSTDFEKALRIGMQMGGTEFLIIGINGGEFEHTINNWSIFQRYCNYTTLEVFDAGRIGKVVRSSFHLPTQPGETISIIPLPRAQITTHGLTWELSSTILEFGIREGARNQSRSNSIEISIEDGCAVIFYDAFAPWRPAESYNTH